MQVLERQLELAQVPLQALLLLLLQPQVFVCPLFAPNYSFYPLHTFFYVVMLFVTYISDPSAPLHFNISCIARSSAWGQWHIPGISGSTMIYYYEVIITIAANGTKWTYPSPFPSISSPSPLLPYFLLLSLPPHSPQIYSFPLYHVRLFPLRSSPCLPLDPKRRERGRGGYPPPPPHELKIKLL